MGNKDTRLKPVKAGDVISAEQWNLLIENIKGIQAATFGIGDIDGFQTRSKASFWQPFTSTYVRHSRQEMYLAVPQSLEYDNDRGCYYFECRIYWPDADYFPRVNPAWWITPPDETKPVYIASGTDPDKVRLYGGQSDEDEYDVLVVLGNYTSSPSPSRLTLTYKDRDNQDTSDGIQQAWQGTIEDDESTPIVLHPGDATAYAIPADDGPLGYLLKNPQNHIQLMQMTTTYFQGPASDLHWRIPFSGNRQVASYADSSSWFDFRAKTCEVVWQTPPPPGYEVYVFYEREDDWHYMWIDTVSPAIDALTDKLTICCGCEYDVIIDGAQKGSIQNNNEDFEYPIPNQAQWQVFRNGVFAGLNNVGAPQTEPIGQLGRYGAFTHTIIDGDTLNIDLTAMSNDDLQFHFDTSVIDPAASILNVVLIWEHALIDTAFDGEDYTQKFTYSLRDDVGNVLRNNIDSSVGDFLGSLPNFGRYKITLPATIINRTGNTTFRFYYEEAWGDPPTYPLKLNVGVPDDASQFWQGFISAPTAKLVVLTDLPCD